MARKAGKTYVGKVLLKAWAIAGEPIVLSDEVKDAILDMRADYTVAEAARILIGELYGTEGGREVSGDELENG